MSISDKLLLSILSGTHDTNIKFRDLQNVLESYGFRCRIKGDHYIYTRKGVDEIINIQPNGNKVCSMHKYERIIYWSEPDNAFIVEVPELSGCMADGKTAQEALDNCDIIISEWIETAKEESLPIPEPKGRLLYA